MNTFSYASYSHYTSLYLFERKPKEVKVQSKDLLKPETSKANAYSKKKIKEESTPSARRSPRLSKPAPVCTIMIDSDNSEAEIFPASTIFSTPALKTKDDSRRVGTKSKVQAYSEFIIFLKYFQTPGTSRLPRKLQKSENLLDTSDSSAFDFNVSNKTPGRVVAKKSTHSVKKAKRKSTTKSSQKSDQ